MDITAELSQICLVEGCLAERIWYENGGEFIRSDGSLNKMDFWVYPCVPSEIVSHNLSISLFTSSTK